MRGLGVTRAAAGSVPHALVPLLAAFTYLGAPSVLVALAASVHWFGPRLGLRRERDAPRLLAVGLVLFGVVVALKATFALPRPPAGVELVAADGYGFPSGHATAAAAIYGGAAALFARPRRWLRWLLCGSLAAAVAASRLLLGVHYLVDVLAGALLGVVGAAVVLRATRRRPVVGFALAPFSGAAGLWIAGPTADALSGLGLGVGALAGFLLVARVGRGRVDAPLALAGYVVFGGLAALALTAGLSAGAVLITSGVAGAGVTALPATRPSLSRVLR